MKKHYLPFEKPLKDLDIEIEKIISSNPESDDISLLNQKRIEIEKEIFRDLSPWETVQLARHPNRPYTLDYIKKWCENFTELHGDSEPCMWMIALGCLFMALLIALIFNRWANISTFSTGLKAGFFIGLLYSLSMNFFMYSSKEIDTDFFIIMAIETISVAILGGAIGAASGFFGKKD